MACRRRGCGGDQVAELEEQFVFELFGALFGGEDLFFVFLELGRDVAFGVFERLLADVVGRDFLAMRRE